MVNWTTRAWTDSHVDYFTRNIITHRDGSTSVSGAAAREANLFRSNEKPKPWPLYEDVSDWAHSEGFTTGDGTSNTEALKNALSAARARISERTGLQVHPVGVDGEVDYNEFLPIPAEVWQACVIYAHRIYRRRMSADGTLGASAFGGAIRVGRMDPDIEALIANHLRIGLA